MREDPRAGWEQPRKTCHPSKLMVLNDQKITPTTSARETCPMPLRSLVPFLLISFGLAWGILGLYILFPERMGVMFGQLTGSHPLFYLAVYSPAIAAFILVARTGGPAGLRRYLGRALLWRCSAAWYAFLIIGVPLIFVAGSGLRGSLFTEPFPFQSYRFLVAALVLAAIKGPMEEFGWRGFALPLLQRKFAPLWSGLILGGIWGLWHLPAFLLSATQQSEWSFTAFLAGCLAISVIATALFNGSNGSILLSAFFHFSLMNPIFPDAQPYDSYILIVFAALIAWRKHNDMFTKEGAVVEVIPHGKAADGCTAPPDRTKIALRPIPAGDIDVSQNSKS